MRIELSPAVDETSTNRRATRVASDLRDVVLHTDSESRHRGEVVDESFGGIGLRFASCPGLAPGQEVEVSYSGVETCAVVRHAQEDESGAYRVGIEWMAESLARTVRELSALQAEFVDDGETSAFLRVLPGGVYMMWKFLEAEKWDDLSDTLKRLSREARIAGIDWLDSLIVEVQTSLDEGRPKQAIRKEVCYLFEECLDIVRQKHVAGGAQPVSCG